MKENMIVHVPHSSLTFPEEFIQRLKFYVDKENLFNCDYLVNEFVPKEYHLIKFNYSRLVL